MLRFSVRGYGAALTPLLDLSLPELRLDFAEESILIVLPGRVNVT